MLKKALLALILATTCYLTLSYLLKREVNGKILIVQANGQSVPLALLDVRAIRESDAIAWKQSVSNDLESILTEIKQTSEIARTSAESASEQLRTSSQDISMKLEKMRVLTFYSKKVWMNGDTPLITKRQLIERLMETRSDACQKAVRSAENSDWQSVYETLQVDLDSLETKAQELEVRMKEINENSRREFQTKIEFLVKDYKNKLRIQQFEETPNWIRISDADRTDEQGSFKFRLAPGRYYVIAKGERQLFKDKEVYYWAHPFDVPSKESEKLLLGNMNLLGTYGDDLWSSFIYSSLNELTQYESK